MDRDPNEIYDEGVAATKAWRDEERAKFAATGEGSWLLRELAAASGGRLVEDSPGHWIISKLPDGDF